MPAQPVLPQPRYLLLAVNALLILPQLTNIPLLLWLWFLAMLGWQAYRIRLNLHTPQRTLKLLLILWGVASLINLPFAEWNLELGLAILIFSFGLKLFELTTPRDIYIFCYAGLVVTTTLFLFNQSIAMLIYSLVIVCGLLAVLTMLNAETATYQHSLKTTTALLLQALPLAIMVFVFFPRFPAPKWMQLSQGRVQSGLSESMEPGAINELVLSQELVFRAKFTGPTPPRQQLYWRGPVLSYTDGRVWQALHNDFERFQEELKTTGTAYEYTELLEPQLQNWVYPLEMPISYAGDLKRNGYYQLRTLSKQLKAAEFQLVSSSDYHTGAITKTEYKESLQLPAQPSMRILELVKKLKGFDAKPAVFIQEVLKYYRDQQFVYTLQPPRLGIHPIESFLFEAKSGFCAHYASSFVYLMRVADIPARVVTGYQGGQFNPIGQFWEIRQADAHAWAEVWMAEQGWVRVDPTSAAQLAEAAQANALANQLPEQSSIANSRRPNTWQHLQLILNNIDYQWQRWIIHYGNNSQSQVFAKLGLDTLSKLALGLLVITSLLATLLALFVLRKRRKPEAPALRLYRKFCHKMSKFGIKIRAGEGPCDFARRAKQHRPELSWWIDEVTALFIRLHYQRIHSEQDLAMLSKRVQDFRVWR